MDPPLFVWVCMQQVGRWGCSSAADWCVLATVSCEGSRHWPAHHFLALPAPCQLCFRTLCIGNVCATATRCKTSVLAVAGCTVVVWWV